MTKRKLVITTSLVLLAAMTQLRGGQGADVRAFMRAKLDHSQRVLEGLATEDFKLISKNAGLLTALSMDTDWNVIQSAEYRQQSKDFQRNTEALSKAARAKNLDAATLAYVQVTLNCVECHKHVRQVQGDASN